MKKRGTVLDGRPQEKPVGIALPVGLLKEWSHVAVYEYMDALEDQQDASHNTTNDHECHANPLPETHTT